MHTFKHEGYEASWERRVAWRASLGGSRKTQGRRPVAELRLQRREMIRYPQFRAQGWEIGSDPTELQCKLSVSRLKGYGRRWHRPNAAAVAALDCLERSSQWGLYWPTPTRQASWHRQESLVTPVRCFV